MRHMNYEKQKLLWRKRRQKITDLLAAGVARKYIARQLGITRQRLSQLERAK